MTAALEEFVVLDTETTGLGARAEAVEVAAVLLRGSRILRSYHSLVRATQPVSYEAAQVHGIDARQLRGAPTPAEVLRALYAFVGDRPCVAYNASFDRRVLENTRAVTRLAPPRLELYCALRLARRAFPTAANHRLSTIAAHVRATARPTHRALDDARAAARVFVACRRTLGPAWSRQLGAPLLW